MSPVAWENVSLEWLEKVRLSLRDLMKFLVGDKGQWFIVDIEDVITYDGESTGVTTRMSYKQRVLDFLAANRNLPVLEKIYNLEKLEPADFRELERILWAELGSKEDYEKFTAGMPCGPNVAIFIRSLIGVDRKRAMLRFGDFISGASLNAEQEEFLSTIVSYVCENGDITSQDLINVEPFSEVDWVGVFGAQTQGVGKFVRYIHDIVVA